MTTLRNTPQRRDPMTEVVGIDSNRIAFDLLNRGQNLVYWKTVATPLRPLGRVPFEGLRQLATFVVPGALFALLYFMLPGLTDLYLSVAALLAVALGFGLDAWLRRDLARQLRIDQAFDAGRYEGTRHLCARLGLKPEEITIEMLYKMAKDYIPEAKRRKAEWHRRFSREAIKEAAVRAHQRMTAAQRRRENQMGAAAAAAATSAAAAELYDQGAEAGAYEPFDLGLPPVNTNGLPMLQGTPIDVAGNAYGTDNTY